MDEELELLRQRALARQRQALALEESPPRDMGQPVAEAQSMPPLVPAMPMADGSIAPGYDMPEGWFVEPQVQPAPPRSWGDAIYDNLIGADDGIDSIGEQVGRGLGSGIARGAAGLASLPQLGMRGLGWGAEKIGDAIGLDGEALRQGLLGGFPLGLEPTPSELGSQLFPETFDYQPDTTAGRYAQTVGEFLPGALAMGPGGVVRNALQYGVAPGLTSEAAGQAFEGTAVEPYARIVGALAGPAIAGGVERVARRAITPYPGADPERLRMADLLREQGIDVSAGQRIGDESLRRIEGSTRAGQALERVQSEQLTRRAMELIGSDAPRATPEALQAARSRIGDVFGDVARGVDVLPDPQHLTRLAQVNAEYGQLMAGGSQVPIIRNVLSEMTSAYRSGNPVAASDLMNWRSLLSRATTSSDGATVQAAAGALEVLDDALTATLQASGRGADVARLTTARQQWRDLLAIQRAAAQASESAQVGILSPGGLYQAVTGQGRDAMALGTRGEMGELASAARGVMGALPNSGTPAGIVARYGRPTPVTGGAGALIGNYLMPGGGGALIGGAIGASAIPARNFFAMSPTGQAYFANQAVGAGPSLLPGWGPVVNALAATQGRQ